MGDFLAHHAFMFGLLDEVAIFSVDLSEDQINAIRENGLQAALGVHPQGKLTTRMSEIKKLFARRAQLGDD